MKDFQEPWHIGIFEDVDRLRYILEGNDFYDVGECNTPELAERVKVCVNSCKGIENPEVINDLILAAKELVALNDSAHWPTKESKAVKDLLAKLNRL